MRRILTATITALMLLLAVGIPAAAIIGGEPDGDRHPYVGMVWGSAGAGEYAWACSGTLIAPTVFLTAGHCTQLAEEVDAPSMSHSTPRPTSTPTRASGPRPSTHTRTSALRVRRSWGCPTS